MPRLRHALRASLLALLAPLTTRAQVDASIDAGAAHLRQFDLPQADVATFGARLRWEGIRTSVASSAISALTPEGAFSAQGLAAASVYAEPLQSWRWELGGSVSTFGGSNALPTTGLQLLAREHFVGDRAGAFVGVGGGGVVLDHLWRYSAIGQVGGWWRVKNGMLSAVVSGTDTRSLLRVPVGNGVYNETHPVTYTDAAVFWQSRWDRMELELGAGMRGGIRNTQASALWGSASAVLWVAPRVALVVSRGRALEDVVRGLPQAHYLTAALRIGLRAHYRPRAPGAPAGIDALLLSVALDDDGERHVITVRASNATAVEIMGDFTDWEPVQLERVDDTWRLERDLPQGAHRVAVRIDGGAWRVPSNLPRVSDDFGGAVGLLSVP